jgi:hypothetical protein
MKKVILFIMAAVMIGFLFGYNLIRNDKLNELGTQLYNKATGKTEAEGQEKKTPDEIVKILHNFERYRNSPEFKQITADKNVVSTEIMAPFISDEKLPNNGEAVRRNLVGVSAHLYCSSEADSKLLKENKVKVDAAFLRIFSNENIRTINDTSRIKSRIAAEIEKDTSIRVRQIEFPVYILVTPE